MGNKSSGGERVAWAIGTGGLSELNRPLLNAGQSAIQNLNAPAEEARKQTELLAKQQREMAERSANEKTAMDKELQDKMLKEQQGLEARTAKQRQAKLAAGAKGRSDTILTGPLGLTASGPKSGKTLLGAQLLSERQILDILNQELKNERSTFDSHWREISDYVLPRRARFTVSDVNKGERKNQKIIDSTATLAARTLRSGMMSGVTSPARPWFRLSVQDPDLAQFKPVETWLYDVSNRMTGIFLRTNLYNVLPVVYGDLGVFGTAAMVVEEDFDEVVRFYPFPIGSYCLANDHRLKVNVFQREFRMTVRQLVNKFGKLKDDGSGKPDWSVFSNQVRSLWESGNYEAWIDVIHIVKPNPDYDPRKTGPWYKKFVSYYYEDACFGGKIREEKFLRKAGYDYFPVLAPRWEISGEDVYGTSCPGMDSLGDIKQLQVGERRGAQAIEKMVNPPMTGPTSLKNTRASIAAGDITYVDARDQGSAFRPAHETNLRIDLLEGKQQQIRSRIQRSFYEDLFLMLATMDRANITATEIAERKEEKLLALGPVLEQLNQDLLDPLIDVTFDIMLKQGYIPEPPKELQGMDLKVEYVSVMAQAQKLVGINSIERFAGFAGQVASMKPDIWDKVNIEAVIDTYADMLSVPPTVLNDEEEVAAIRNERAQAAAQQQQVEQLAQVSASAKNLATAPMDQGSALDALVEQSNAGALV